MCVYMYIYAKIFVLMPSFFGGGRGAGVVYWRILNIFYRISYMYNIPWDQAKLGKMASLILLVIYYS